MADIDVRIEGLAELQATLDSVKTTQAKAILNRGLRAGAAVFKAAIEERAPVRPDLPSGTALPPGALIRDIEVHARQSPAGTAIVTVGPGKYTRHVARWVEFGHRLVRGGRSKLLPSGKTKGPGQQVGQVPAHPFERPAYEAAYGPALDAVKASIRADVDRIRGRRAE